ncbi:MAG TPA: hypothetical protein VGQ20_10665 [Acidimicrobiales bacterium]|nr:hypothetical protein [Acidimicrobiales bacterium]
MRVAVEQVIQTAARVLEGEITAREAITILATLTRDALPAARELREDEPERAVAYRELIAAMERELRLRDDNRAESRYLHAVIEDLTKVADALA